MQTNTLYLQVVDEFTTAETHLHMWGGSLGMVDRNGADRRTEGHLTYMDPYHSNHPIPPPPPLPPPSSPPLLGPWGVRG